MDLFASLIQIDDIETLANDEMVFPSCEDDDSEEVNNYIDNLLEPHARLSMAYCYFTKMPNRIASKLGNRVKNLDISHNDFTDLNFLGYFHNLHTLVLDRNPNPKVDSFPSLPSLRILWINNCNITNIHSWIYKLREQCPQLEHLSMMCNPVGDTQLNGVTEDVEEEYRIAILRILPKLVVLDGRRISDVLRRKANIPEPAGKKFSNRFFKRGFDFCSGFFSKAKQ